MLWLSSTFLVKQEAFFHGAFFHCLTSRRNLNFVLYTKLQTWRLLPWGHAKITSLAANQWCREHIISLENAGSCKVSEAGESLCYCQISWDWVHILYATNKQRWDAYNNPNFILTNLVQLYQPRYVCLINNNKKWTTDCDQCLFLFCYDYMKQVLLNICWRSHTLSPFAQ